ncbi:MAG: hypothetical protein RLZZ165_1817, partial [Bacteroidota bacterium]
MFGVAGVRGGFLPLRAGDGCILDPPAHH